MVDYILLDIIGTILPVSHVGARSRLWAEEGPEFLLRNARHDHIKKELEQAFGKDPVMTAIGYDPRKPLEEQLDKAMALAFTEEVARQMKERRFQPEIMEIRGRMFLDAYDDGKLKPVVFKDVPEALESWQANGITSGAYSHEREQVQRAMLRNAYLMKTGENGFVDSQRLNLEPMLSDFFDPSTVGSKTTPSTYEHIATILRLYPDQIIFVSDRTEELDPAQTAGMKTVHILRPGNPDTEFSIRHGTVESLLDVKY